MKSVNAIFHTYLREQIYSPKAVNTGSSHEAEPIRSADSTPHWNRARSVRRTGAKPKCSLCGSLGFNLGDLAIAGTRQRARRRARGYGHEAGASSGNSAAKWTRTRPRK